MTDLVRAFEQAPEYITLFPDRQARQPSYLQDNRSPLKTYAFVLREHEIHITALMIPSALINLAVMIYLLVAKKSYQIPANRRKRKTISVDITKENDKSMEPFIYLKLGILLHLATDVMAFTQTYKQITDVATTSVSIELSDTLITSFACLFALAGDVLYLNCAYKLLIIYRDQTSHTLIPPPLHQTTIRKTLIPPTFLLRSITSHLSTINTYTSIYLFSLALLYAMLSQQTGVLRQVEMRNMFGTGSRRSIDRAWVELTQTREYFMLEEWRQDCLLWYLRGVFLGGLGCLVGGVGTVVESWGTSGRRNGALGARRRVKGKRTGYTPYYLILFALLRLLYYQWPPTGIVVMCRWVTLYSPANATRPWWFNMVGADVHVKHRTLGFASVAVLVWLYAVSLGNRGAEGAEGDGDEKRMDGSGDREMVEEESDHSSSGTEDAASSVSSSANRVRGGWRRHPDYCNEGVEVGGVGSSLSEGVHVGRTCRTPQISSTASEFNLAWDFKLTPTSSTPE